MLNLVLSAIAIIGVLILLHTAIANNKNFLYVMLLVKPFIDITVNVTLIGSLNGLELSGMLIFIAILIKYINLSNQMPIKNHSLIWFFIFMQMLSFILAYSVGSQVLINGGKFFLKLLNGYFIYFIAANELMDTSEKRILNYRNIWVTTFIMGLITIIVYETGLSNSDITRGLTRYNGLYNDPGTPSYLAVLCITFGNLYHEVVKPKMTRTLNIIYILSWPLTFYVLFLTLTKSALIMFFVYLIMWYGLHKGKMLLVLPFLVLSIIIGFTYSTGLNTRFATEINYVESGGDAEAAKSVGTGRVNRWGNLLEGFSEADLPTKFLGTSKPLNAHNQYIAYLMQAGILGLSLFLIMLFRFTTKLYYLYQKTNNPEIFTALVILSMYIVYGFTGHPFYYTTLLWYLMIMLSIINVYTHQQRKKDYIEKKQLLKRNKEQVEQYT